MDYMDLLPPTAPSLVFARETCTPYSMVVVVVRANATRGQLCLLHSRTVSLVLLMDLSVYYSFHSLEFHPVIIL